MLKFFFMPLLVSAIAVGFCSGAIVGYSARPTVDSAIGIVQFVSETVKK